MDKKAQESYNKLAQLMQPFREVRGFYFGARAIIFRMCVPKQDTDTSYGEFKEIQVQMKGDGLAMDYKPIRRVRFSRIKYTANLRSPLLDPLRNPIPGGDENLKGYFDKNRFDLILKVIEDMVVCVTAKVCAFNAVAMNFDNGSIGTLKRVDENTPNGSTISYRCYVRDNSGKDVPSEEIKFHVEGNLNV